MGSAFTQKLILGSNANQYNRAKEVNLRRKTILLLAFLISIFLTIGSVRATFYEFNIQPKQEITVNTQSLSPPGNITGNVTVKNGLVDFYVSYPSGKTMFCHNQTKDCTFDLTISETGNYTFHFVNSFSAENVTVVLNYTINLKVSLQVNYDVGASVGTVTVVAPLPPPPRQLRPKLDDLYTRYGNFQKAKTIYQMINNAWIYMPLGPMEIMWIIAIILLPILSYYRISTRQNVQKNK